MPDLMTLLSPKNIVVFMLIFTRLSGMLISAPVFSSFPIPPQVKIWFCALISFIMYPILSAKAAFIMPHSAPEFTILLAVEFAIGFLIGFLADLIFAGIKMAGHLISIQMGLSMAEILDPATEENTSVMSNMYIYLATLVFFALNAHQWLFGAIYKSFFVMPPGLMGVFDSQVALTVLKLSAQMFAIAFQLVMPIFAVLLVCDILLGLMSKMMPQMNIFMVSLPFKIYMGLILMLLFLGATMGYLKGLILEYMENILHLFA